MFNPQTLQTLTVKYIIENDIPFQVLPNLIHRDINTLLQIRQFREEEEELSEREEVPGSNGFEGWGQRESHKNHYRWENCFSIIGLSDGVCAFAKPSREEGLRHPTLPCGLLSLGVGRQTQHGGKFTP